MRLASVSEAVHRALTVRAGEYAARFPEPLYEEVAEVAYELLAVELAAWVDQWRPPTTVADTLEHLFGEEARRIAVRRTLGR